MVDHGPFLGNPLPLSAYYALERFKPCSQCRGLGSSAEGSEHSRGGDGIESGRTTTRDARDLVQVP